MSEPTPAPASRFTLRQLPLPAKLVITGFLLSVGLGYTAAMVQLHMQDAKTGKPMPTPEDVVLKFTGKKWMTSAPPRPVSKLEKLIMGPVEGAPFNGTGSMGPVFFKKDGANYKELTEKASPEVKAKIDAEREGERLALYLWINTPEEERKRTYETDRFVIAPEKAPKAITSEFTHNPAKIGDGIKVKSILTTRCVRCHAKDGDVAQFPLEVFAELERYMEAPGGVEVPPGGGWVKVEEPIGMEKLTQSTHAHLLSFAMLFSLTGLVFAFTSYCGCLRGILSPLALLAVVTDVVLWWLARLSDDAGPYFAMAIIGTGGVVGLSLGAQIVLSLFNMYGRAGKLVIATLFAVGLGAGGAVYVNKVEQALKDKQERLQAAKQPAKPAPNVGKPGNGQNPPKTDEKKGPPPVPSMGPSRLERALTGEFRKDGPWADKAAGIVPPGGMVRAFFDKEREFKDALKANDPTLPMLIEERKGEQFALLEWAKAPPDVRKKAYDDDAFLLPEQLRGKPTKDYAPDGKTFKVKTLIGFRCETCHTDGNDVPLDNWAGLEKVLAPRPAAKPLIPGSRD